MRKDWVFFYCREGFLFSPEKIPPTRHQLLNKKEGSGINTRPTNWFSSGGNMAEAVAAERLTCWETAPDLAAAPRWNFPQISHHPPEKETAGTELFLGEAGRPPGVGAKKGIRVFFFVNRIRHFQKQVKWQHYMPSINRHLCGAPLATGPSCSALIL